VRSDPAFQCLMAAHRGKFVAYFRLSPDRHGKSGLGLEAQREAVLADLRPLAGQGMPRGRPRDQFTPALKSLVSTINTVGVRTTAVRPNVLGKKPTLSRPGERGAY